MATAVLFSSADLADLISRLGTGISQHARLHNIGKGVVEDNSLFLFKITGRYRLPPLPEAGI